jgi:hypothetical protein
MSSAGSELELVRAAFRDVASVREIKMFGGTAFLVRGHMTVAVSPRGLLVRVGPNEHDDALKRPGTRAMEMRGRVMTGYVYIDPAPNDARMVQSWVQSALRHNGTLPPKMTRRAPSKKRTATKEGDRP